jgi:hypothetical protein
LPPGPNIYTCQDVIVDTGAPKSLLSRACAVGFGLMAGNPAVPVPGFLDPTHPRKNIGGIGGGAVPVNTSRPLSMNAGGLGGPVVQFKDVPNINIQYPSPLAGISLIGNDFTNNLAPGQATTIRRNLSVSFLDNENSTTGFHTPFNVRPAVDGGVKFVFPVDSVVLTGPSGPASGEFTIATGAESSIISSVLAAQLGVTVGGPVTLDPETQELLFCDGFIDLTTTLMSAVIPSLTVNTSDGPLVKTNVPVWVNHDSTENVFGFPELFFDNDAAEVRVHEFHDITFVPAPGAVVMVGVGALLVGRRSRRAAEA